MYEAINIKGRDMKREQFIRQLRKEAKNADLPFSVDTRLGKGSHYRVRVGEHVSKVPHGDLSPTMMKIIGTQLGLL